MRILKCCVLVLSLLLLIVSSSGLAGIVQPPPGTGIVYVTRTDSVPNGAIVLPQDLGLGIMLPIVNGLSSPADLLCGPDARLYVNEPYGTADRMTRILRFNQDGSGRTEVASWFQNSLRPGAMVFSPNGDLYFGTVSTRNGSATQGIWRIPNAVRQSNVPQQILPPAPFLRAQEDTLYNAQPYGFLNSGTFQGDLLILDHPGTSGLSGGHVFRAPKPNFDTVVEFIPAFNDEETKLPFLPSGLAINSKGDIFATDFTNSKVLRFSPEGKSLGVFARVPRANQIAIGPDDNVYVTNVSFPAGGGAVRGGLFVFAADGRQLAGANYPLFLRGVTVCPPRQ